MSEARSTNLPALVLANLGEDTKELRDALADLPDRSRWGGLAHMPWGLAANPGSTRSNLEVVSAGRSSFFFKGHSGMYDSLRDAFVAERMCHSRILPWEQQDLRRAAQQVSHASRPQRSTCGCIRPPSLEAMLAGTPAAAVVDCDAQLEHLRAVLRQILLEMPSLDLQRMTADLFGGQPVWCEHYLWWIESEAFVAHAGDERQDCLTLTTEGCSILVMLELTKPGSNRDMSPRAIQERKAARLRY